MKKRQQIFASFIKIKLKNIKKISNKSFIVHCISIKIKVNIAKSKHKTMKFYYPFIKMNTKT